MNTSAVIDGDINDDGTLNDVTIFANDDISLFALNVDGVDFESTAELNLDIPSSVEVTVSRGVINVSANDASFTNRGNITVDGAGDFGDRTTVIAVTGDNFTFSNLGSDTTITTTGRSVIEAFERDPFTNEQLELVSHVVNEGILIAQDDTVRLTNGSVVNSGTIRSEGTFDFGGFSRFGPGELADAILFFGPESDTYSGLSLIHI